MTLREDASSRLLIKVSGEALMGHREFGLDPDVLARIAGQLATLARSGHQLGIVVGGGNLFRGLSMATDGMDRVSADHIGMLATVMNGLALAQAVRAAGVEAQAFSAIPMPTICDSYSRRDAEAALSRGIVAVFAGGTGNPFFTTDTTAALRAAEIGASALFKATQVDGVYDSDPKHNPAAKRFDTLSFDEVLRRDLKVMDAAAIAIARDNRIPIVVFSLDGQDAILSAIDGTGRSTRIG